MTAVASRFPKVDVRALAREVGIDLDLAFERLEALYADIDARNAANTKSLDLPCHRGCSMCCEQSVFVTPLEFLRAWHEVQETLDDEARGQIVERGLALYQEHRELIEALEGPIPEGDADHFRIASKLAFHCPMLGPGGECQIYGGRELYARLFGCSFKDDGGLYGCILVSQHLAGKTLKLVRVRGAALQLLELPLTFKRQVYPWYINWLYGETPA